MPPRQYKVDKLVPVMVTLFPPTGEPAVGDREVMAGAVNMLRRQATDSARPQGKGAQPRRFTVLNGCAAPGQRVGRLPGDRGGLIRMAGACRLEIPNTRTLLGSVRELVTPQWLWRDIARRSTGRAGTTGRRSHPSVDSAGLEFRDAPSAHSQTSELRHQLPETSIRTERTTWHHV
jgi:hypothetical protein